MSCSMRVATLTRSRPSVFWPAGSDGLELGVEADAVGTVRVQVSEEGALPAGERQVADRCRNADVDTEHPGFDPFAEDPGGGAAAGEDRGGVAKPAAVGDLDRLIEARDCEVGE